MSQPIPDSVVDALKKGRKIEAIKLLRRNAPMDLKTAKATVEQKLAQMQKKGTAPPHIEEEGSPLFWVGLVMLAFAIFIFFKST